MRSSTKIAIGFVVILAGGYFGWKWVTGWIIGGKHFDALAPSYVNIVGIEPKKGFRIQVSNGIAQLIQGGSSSFSGENAGPDAKEEETGDKKRIPIREMLQSMAGDSEALGKFISQMNNLQESDEWPPIRVVWKAEDIQKDLGANLLPGVVMVPAMVIAIEKAQGAGIAYNRQ